MTSLHSRGSTDRRRWIWTWTDWSTGLPVIHLASIARNPEASSKR